VKEVERSRPRESCTPRRPEPPVGGAGPVVNAYCLFFFFPDDAPPPTSSSSSLASLTTTLHQRLHFGPWPPR
jgi:hypothetical protein